MDREESLVHLLRVNVLKLMESAVSSFALTVGRQMADVEATLARIEEHAESVEEVDIADVDIEVWLLISWFFRKPFRMNERVEQN